MPRCSMMVLDHRDSAIDSFESLSPQDEHPAIGNVASQLFTAPHVDKIWYILVFFSSLRSGGRKGEVAL